MKIKKNKDKSKESETDIEILDENTALSDVSKKGAQKSKKLRLIGISAGIIIVIAAIVYAVFMFTYPWYEKPVSKMINAIVKEDETVLNMAYPDFIQATKDEKLTIKRAIADLETYLGDKISISYTVTGKEKIDPAEYEAVCESIFNKYSIESSFTDGIKLTLDVTFKGNETLYSDTYSINVYKIEGSWSVTPDEFNKFIDFINKSCETVKSR